MKTTENNSGNELQRPENENPIQRTLEEVMDEIREIIINTHWVQTRLTQLEANGYQIENCWVKNGSIDTIWYMKRKKVFRIQVSASESHGDYHKANCVVIPASEISLQSSDVSRVRNLPIIKDAKPDTSIPVAKKITENKKR